MRALAETAERELYQYCEVLYGMTISLEEERACIKQAVQDAIDEGMPVEEAGRVVLSVYGNSGYFLQIFNEHLFQMPVIQEFFKPYIVT